MTEEEYQAALKHIEKLMEVDPTADSRYGRELIRVALLIEDYERIHYPFKEPARSAGILPRFPK